MGVQAPEQGAPLLPRRNNSQLTYGCIVQTAIIWEADEPGEHVELTYEQLFQEVCRTANILKSYGVKKGDVGACVCF